MSVPFLKDAVVNAERRIVTIITTQGGVSVSAQEISFADVQVAAFALRQHVLRSAPAIPQPELREPMGAPGAPWD